jgi:dihydrofolate synthase/folylpolyglutamate synthase
LSSSPRRHWQLDDWLSWFQTLHPKQIDMGLERVTTVLDRLGLRAPPYRVVTVAGTNGKGSCVAMLESIYWHAGYDVGAFTSPHLWRFNERIRFNGADAGDAELVEMFAAVDAVLGAVTLSYFESSAVAALLYFARREVDVAVLEVGMGGRLDASNAVAADCALIVSVDLDHREWLGPDREAIGREKAGIMRPGKPAVVADRVPPRSVLDHAASIGARVTLLGRDFDYERGLEREWRRAAGAPTWLPRPRFGGDEQYGNAAACAAVVAELERVLPVGDDALARGIANAYLRGRLERHDVDGTEWLFDIAHNPAAAHVLDASLARLPAPKRTFAVFAAMHDKDLAGVLAPFKDEVERWFVTQACLDRGAPPADLAAVLERLGVRSVEIAASVAAACAAARMAARPGDRVLVFGSFHTVGAATAALGLYCAPSRNGEQPEEWTRV